MSQSARQWRSYRGVLYRKRNTQFFDDASDPVWAQQAAGVIGTSHHVTLDEEVRPGRSMNVDINTHLDTMSEPPLCIGLKDYLALCTPTIATDGPF